MAGTKVRLADGTLVKIEKLVAKQRLQTPHHHAPEGEHLDCEILEVYHNAP
ncbi:MAG: hypothetical protein FWC50_00415 [Planctomycetaceae bacterium]|nr:hypothetical protein [Planctomycetaceae bacterium]